MSDRIEDYAIIGDRETVALVSRSGSIDWLCWTYSALPFGARTEVGLLGEEYGSRAKPGNFPRAVSAVALISTAFEFRHVSGPGEQRARCAVAKAASTCIQ